VQAALGVLKNDGVGEGVRLAVVVICCAGAVVEVDGNNKRRDAIGNGNVDLDREELCPRQSDCAHQVRRLDLR